MIVFVYIPIIVIQLEMTVYARSYLTGRAAHPRTLKEQPPGDNWRSRVGLGREMGLLEHETSPCGEGKRKNSRNTPVTSSRRTNLLGPLGPDGVDGLGEPLNTIITMERPSHTP